MLISAIVMPCHLWQSLEEMMCICALIVTTVTKMILLQGKEML